MPQTHSAIELIAPCSSPISIALLVPTAWLVAPMAMPSATGSVIWNSLAKTGARIAPSTPVIMTAAAVRPDKPPGSLRNADGNRGGHALGQQRIQQNAVCLQYPAQKPHAQDARKAADQTSQHHRPEMLFQDRPLAVNIQRQRRRGGAKEHFDDVCACVIAFQRNMEDQQDGNHQHACDQNGIEDQLSRFLLEADCQPPADQGQRQTEKGGGRHGFKHGAAPSFG